MRGHRRSSAGVATAAAAVCLAGVLAAPSASATGTTSLTASLGCDGGLGRSRFECDLAISGGTAPYSTSWSGTKVVFSTTSTTYAAGYCQPDTPGGNVYATVSATVWDSAGRTTTVKTGFLCYYYPP